MASGIVKSTVWAVVGVCAIGAGALHAAPSGPGADKPVTPAMVVDRGTFCFATGDMAALHAGQMHLETPHADIAVLGTRFILEVNDRFTRVTVLEGRVDVTPHASGTVTPVTPGQAATTTATAVDVHRSTGELPKDLPAGNCN